MPGNQSAWNVTTASWTESIVATAETPENGSTEAGTNRVLPPRFRPPNMQLLDNSAIVIGSVGVTAGAVHGRDALPRTETTKPQGQAKTFAASVKAITFKARGGFKE